MNVYVDDELYLVLPPTTTLAEAIRILKELSYQFPGRDVHLDPAPDPPKTPAKTRITPWWEVM